MSLKDRKKNQQQKAAEALAHSIGDVMGRALFILANRPADSPDAVRDICARLDALTAELSAEDADDIQLTFLESLAEALEKAAGLDPLA